MSLLCTICSPRVVESDFSVKVQEDFTFVISFHGVVDANKFWIRVSFSLMINSGAYSVYAIVVRPVVSSLQQLLNSIGSARLCCGNSDNQFLALPNIHAQQVII